MKNMKAFVTGGAGFIGSNLVDALLEKGYEVTVYDNLSLGTKDRLKQHLNNNNFTFVNADLLDFQKLSSSIKDHEVIFHLAANSDISNNNVTDIDLKQGTLATYNVLEAMRLNGIKKIVYSSTSAVYGEPKVMPTPEDYGPLQPISLYGASKLACEGLMTAFSHNFDFQVWIFRFANIIGKKGTHGVLVDFIRKLRNNPKELEILGDGKQKKSYLEVMECVDGILFGLEKAKEQVNVYNLGCNSSTQVDTIANIIVEEMSLKNVKFRYTGGRRGWKGDVPVMSLDVSKINKLGWKAKLTSDEAVRKSVKDLLKGY